MRRQGAYLPHWTREGGTYFVTFRLADSLPAAVLDQWVREREGIVRRAAAMGRELSAQELARLDRLHSERVESYLDAGHGACHLAEPRIAELVWGALLHFNGARYEMVAWCVMPNHVHVVVRPLKGFELARIVHSWKSFTSNRANEVLGREGAFWQAEGYDHLVRDTDDLRRVVMYVLRNPVVAGLGGWEWVGCADWVRGEIASGAWGEGEAG